MIRALVLFLLMTVQVHAAERVLVFGAASQKDALEAIGELYEMQCGCDVVFSFGATSTLARQVHAGAPADVFVSANEAWADWLEIKGRLVPETRVVFAGNRLVIASTETSEDSFNILWRGRFAMADPVSVPAGIYAREAMESLGLWEKARSNAVFSENVRVALISVKRGDLMSGIVYQSDLHLVPELRSHFVFPEDSHSAIHYVGASVKGSVSGAGFVRFLTTPKAQDILKRFGFLNILDTQQG